MITKRPQRLVGVSYVGYQRYFLTTCTHLRHPVFTSEALATEAIAQLLRHAALFEFAVLAYCVMPDHLHALVEAESERADFTAFVKRFKQMTGFQHRKQTQERLWQHGYHERTLRDEEATDAIVRYILENPIRAGLTKRLGEYRFAGSGVYDVSQLTDAWSKQT